MFNNGCGIMQVKGAELSWESTCDCVRTPDSRSCCAVSSGGDRGRGWVGGWRSSQGPVQRHIHCGKEEGHLFFKSRTKGEREHEGGEEIEVAEETGKYKQQGRQRPTFPAQAPG